LVSENFFGQIQSWCRAHNIPSGGHLLMEESPAAHVPLYGDFFRCIRRLDAPSIDCLTSLPPEVPWSVARLLASAAELEGRTLVMSETSDHGQVYRPAGDTRPKRVVTEAEIRGTCYRQMVAGVNRITSYYSFTGLGDETLRRLNEWVGRCGAALTGGHQVADIAVLYPSETLMTKFVPSRHWARDAADALRVEGTFRAAADALFNAQRDFTYVDSRALAEARVDGGTLAHGSLRWRIVVLPASDTLPLAAWNNVARFVKEGGVVIALGVIPANSELEFPSGAVRSASREVFGPVAQEPRVQANEAGGAGIFLPAGCEGLLPAVLHRVLAPDIRVSDNHSPVRATHRRVEGREVYFVINDSAKPWSGAVSFSAVGEAVRWLPATGRSAPMGANARLELALEPYDAVFVTFDRAVTPARLPIRGDALPSLVTRGLPLVQPTLGRGEFVDGELRVDDTRPGAAAWRSTARLTKGQVDTFQFARFNYSPALDLSDADCVVLDTWVPAGQRTPNELLVILHEDGGGDFIAHTGRGLGEPGHRRSFVPMNQFQHAGWSKDADGVLDRKRVRGISVGWGGYLGAAGERVEFTLAAPQAGALSDSSRSPARR
jgi:hypothetical protein